MKRCRLWETLNPETFRRCLSPIIGKLEACVGDILKRQKEAKAPLTSYT